MIPTAGELAQYTLERQRPLLRSWVDDAALLAALKAGRHDIGGWLQLPLGQT